MGGGKHYHQTIQRKQMTGTLTAELGKKAEKNYNLMYTRLTKEA